MTVGIENSGRLDIAVVGAGISGLACAWLLSQWHRVTLYEAAPRLGGHTNTIDVAGQPVDTGFIVYNERTYPNLTALLRHLRITTQSSDMSFAVSLDDGRLEYAGTDLRGLFGQRSNLLNPRFMLMLRDLLRFYREAPARLVQAGGLTLGQLLDRDRYGRAFRDNHLLPVASAVWSAPAGTMLDFPAETFVRFCDTHGLLQVADRPVWRTITGGSKRYVGPLTAGLVGRVRLDSPVRSVARTPGLPTLAARSALAERYDHIVLATHADEALALLVNPDPEDRQILGAFRYSRNEAVLHSDARLMPKRKAVWSSWNYLGRRGEQAQAVRVTYWMNKLQSLPPARDYFVSLNPELVPTDIIYETTYTHPIFDLAAIEAQKRLWSLQGKGNIWFCGAHFGAGFHEDGLQAGLAVAEAIGGVRRPWHVAAESGRIHLPSAVPPPRVAA